MQKMSRRIGLRKVEPGEYGTEDGRFRVYTIGGQWFVAHRSDETPVQQFPRKVDAVHWLDRQYELQDLKFFGPNK